MDIMGEEIERANIYSFFHTDTEVDETRNESQNKTVEVIPHSITEKYSLKLQGLKNEKWKAIYNKLRDNYINGIEELIIDITEEPFCNGYVGEKEGEINLRYVFKNIKPSRKNGKVEVEINLEEVTII